jgi:superfamily II DNA or RNA helicase
MITDTGICLDEEEATGFRLRDYQQACIAAVEEGWRGHSRLLIVLGTGGGKTVIFSHLAKMEVERGGKVLILAHTDELLDQAIDKLQRSTGLFADKEKADSRASPFASVVVASVQTLHRDARLTSFPHDHFSLVIVDESHRVLAKSYQKILAWFHFGPASREEGWKMPSPAVNHDHFARVLGVTATPDRGDRRNLGEFYARCVFDHGMLQLCRDGYLVRPIVKNIPLQIDIRGVKKTAGDYDASEVAHKIAPFLKQIAQAVALHARDRKTVVFTPSVETARLMAEALAAEGIDASFVSGSCPDRHAKIETFHGKGNGSAIANAMLLTEGWDHAEVSCIVPLRITKIRSLLTQCVGRGTRPLTGIIDGLDTVEERLAAIAASAKKDLLVFDFLWLADRLDLVGPVDLFASNPEIRKAMLKSKHTDLLKAEEEAQRDFLKALEKEARKHQHKQPRTIDPLAWAVSVGDAMLASYVPDSAQDAAPPTRQELEFLLSQNIDTSVVKTSGLAQKLISRVIERKKLGLASIKQLNFLKQLGVPEEQAALMKASQAGAIIGRGTASWRRS